jgi:putative transposase
MTKAKSLYRGYRFPAAVISCAVRWHPRFNLSLGDIEELLLERCVRVTYAPKGVLLGDDTVRRRCDKFGEAFAARARATRLRPGSTWHLD